MVSKNICAFIVVCAVSLGIAAVVYVLIGKSLRKLLDDVVRLPAGTVFYLRSFVVSIVFIALSSCLGTSFVLKPHEPFMSYAWQMAGGISSTFGTAWSLSMTIGASSVNLVWSRPMSSTVIPWK